MNVLWAAMGFYPTFSGTVIRFMRYAPGLKNQGINLRVFAGTPQSIGETLLACASHPPEGIEDIPIHRVDVHRTPLFRRDLEYLQALFNYCRHSETRPDIIHFLFSSPFWRLKSRSFRRLGIPIVQSYTLLGESSPNPLKRTLQHFLWKSSLHTADCVISNSDIADVMLKAIGVTRRIEVIPNGVNLQRFRPTSSEYDRRIVRQKLGLECDADLVLYVGSLTERKGVDVLIRAWPKVAERFPKARLLLVGPVGKEMYQRTHSPDFQFKIEQEIAQSQYGSRILLTGKVDNVEDYYRASDIFVFPSRREGMPNAVLEAMASGIPCILTPFLGLSDAFGHANEQYNLADRTPQALAQAVIALLEDQTRREQLGYHGRQWAEAHMDLDKSLYQYAMLYRELVRKQS